MPWDIDIRTVLCSIQEALSTYMKTTMDVKNWKNLQPSLQTFSATSYGNMWQRGRIWLQSAMVRARAFIVFGNNCDAGNQTKDLKIYCLTTKLVPNANLTLGSFINIKFCLEESLR